ncbi:retinol dehydrogenase 12 [Microdochium nivale]|nr:retinol dehydrogenase 12 [Microdochium nivale]
MASVHGRVIMITGSSVGLGKQLALELARIEPARIWLTGRRLDTLESAANDIRRQWADAPPFELLPFDLGSFQSIKQAARTFLDQCPTLDVLVLNAGVMSLPHGCTTEGYEIQFGVNHMGHALLTSLLLPALLAAKKPRVVVVSSSSHHDAPRGGIKWSSLKTPGDDIFILQRYGQSKLANILFARELARRYPKLRAASIHPGVVRGTEMQRRATGIPFILRILITLVRLLFTVSLHDGVQNQIWACINDDYESGEYYEPIGVPHKASADATDDVLAKDLWDWTVKEFVHCGII